VSVLDVAILGRPEGQTGRFPVRSPFFLPNYTALRLRLTLTLSLSARPHVMEPDQINILASTMFRDLEQVQNAKESRLSRQFRSNIRKPDRFNRVNFNFAFLHSVSRPHSNAGTHPDSHTASDFSPTYPLPQPLSEHHEQSLRPTLQCVSTTPSPRCRFW
jgi:hypothetical protein